MRHWTRRCAKPSAWKARDLSQRRLHGMLGEVRRESSSPDVIASLRPCQDSRQSVPFFPLSRQGGMRCRPKTARNADRAVLYDFRRFPTVILATSSPLVLECETKDRERLAPRLSRFLDGNPDPLA